MPLRAGDRLGPYEVLAPLGAGGMGAVWKARDTKLGRQIAIKVLKEEDQGNLARLVQEARAAAQLNHPNIVTIHEIGEQDGMVFVVMEFIDGRALNEHIGKPGLPIKEALKYAIPIARGLEAAHRRGIIHRDLKPHNVMISAAGDVKLLDFGLAKLSRPMEPANSAEPTTSFVERPNTERGQILGTIAYMSPEQAQGQTIDARSDIFSFGTMLYEMLTGRRPFEGRDSVSILAAILRDEPRPPGQFSATPLPPEADRIVLRCLRKDPERRFQTASDLRSALDDLQAEITSVKLSASQVTAVRPPLSWRMPAALAAIVIVLAIAGWKYLRVPAPRGPVPARQVTFDGGIAATPAFSPDGKLLAFASDRADPGNLDIWLRQTAGGGLIRLTSQPGAEYNPQFSPDGTKIYYLTGDQSIYEVPALGGSARKVIDNAGPFSVSNQGEIAFARPGPVTRPGPIFIVGAGGGEMKPWQPACGSPSRPGWSPDGSKLLFVGECGEKLRGLIQAPRHGGAPEAVQEATSSGSFAASPVWFHLANGQEAIVYASQTGSDWPRLFRFQSHASPAAVTGGTGWERWPAVGPNGELIFTQTDRHTGISSVGLDDHGLTADFAPATIVDGNGHFSVSSDGKTLVYSRLTGGAAGELVIRNLATGKEKVFAEHDLLGASVGSIWPQAGPDGKQIIYRLVGTQGGHYLLRPDTGEVRRVATLEQFQLASDWSPDGKRVLGECPPPRFGICQLDPGSGAVKVLFVHSTDHLLYPSWSWDARAVTFMRRRPAGLTAIWIAPVSRDGVVGGEESWVEIAPPVTDNSRPRFSADGSTLYYLMGRGGQRLLVAQKIDKASHKPAGEPILLLRTPVEVTALTGGGGPYPLIGVTPKRLFYSMTNLRGNLWMTRLD